MCRPTPRRWLSALPLCAAIAFAVPAVLSQAPAATPEQTSVQAPDLSIPLIPAEEMSITPAPVSAANLTSPAAQPDRPPTPEELGDSLMARQRYQAAIEAYKKAPQNSPGVWNKMGIAYQLMFNPDQAAHCYQVSLRIKPLDAPVLNNLATIYDSQQHYGDAQRIYRKALKIDPKSALINKNLGTNLLAQHKYKKGWEAYKVAIEIDPNIFKNSVSPRVQNPASIQERGAMNYFMAKGCVRAGMNDCALDYLRMALNEGFVTPKNVAADSEFAALRGLPAYQQLLSEQTRQ